MTQLVLPSGQITVVAIGAHPDDIEIGCGGTILELADRGADIHSLILTGTPERRTEAVSAASNFGVVHEPTFGGFDDTRLPARWNEVKDTLHRFREAVPSPDLVLLPRAEDAHQDHALLGQLAASVWRGPLILHYEIPKWDGDIGRPNVYVPLSDECAARKVKLLNASFPSQHDKHWWDDEFFLALMRLRGAESQSRYAEAFTTGKLLLRLT
jgi:LmbE family N-acetylglucosaminyl deacetylase